MPDEFPTEKRPWPTLFQPGSMRISATIRRCRRVCKHGRWPRLRRDLRLSVYEDLAAIEKDWRAFEPQADGTVFQSFDWLATWQRHIGARAGVTPAIVVGRDAGGAIIFVLPLSICPAGYARELTWLGSDLCDYNAPVLAQGFSERFDRARFLTLWREIVQLLQSHPRLTL